MADRSPDANHFAREHQSRILAGTVTGLNTLKPIVHFQVSMMRMWADSLERLARNYERGLEETAATAKKRSDKQQAA